MQPSNEQSGSILDFGLKTPVVVPLPIQNLLHAIVLLSSCSEDSNGGNLVIDDGYSALGEIGT
jgi:hypothetical protein